MREKYYNYSSVTHYLQISTTSWNFLIALLVANPTSKKVPSISSPWVAIEYLEAIDWERGLFTTIVVIIKH